MADFSPPFANGGDRREPSPDEQDLGFGCGAADLLLFNWMFWSVQSEINKVIVQGGITPSNGDMTQLWQAIQAMINAATGGGDPSIYLLIAQARARLPIYPEVQNVANHLGVTSPGTGQIRIAAGITFLHRGIFPVTTALTDIALDPSKTYHLRWNPTDGFAIKDLASPIYNSGAVAETDPKFDSTYDDILFARVITNSSNVPTITNLVNKAHLKTTGSSSGACTKTPPVGGDRLAFTGVFGLNWARTPIALFQGLISTSNPAGYRIEGYTNRIVNQAMTRYAAQADVTADYVEGVTEAATGEVNMMAIAS